MSSTAGSPRIPIATYRLQFNAAFTFVDARDIVAYLDKLGISDAYASSYLRAVPGSLHGYDVADPTQLNPEIGTTAEYDDWVAALAEHAMGHVLDLVPNHMGIARSANPWWMDVLENGPSSRYARFFDIEWHPVKAELAEKVLIPTLGDQYGAVLERQELRLAYRDGAFVVEYFEDWWPIAPDTYGQILGHGLERWLADGGGQDAPDDVDELRSIITAADNLPPRPARDNEAIVVRAREKEVMKRRLATLLERNTALRQFVDAAVSDLNGQAGIPRSFDALDRLLHSQAYRLAHWRVASEEINYRRFFDVNQLAALRMEDPVVFDEVHRFAFELIGRGAATGLRVDHVDGLYSPADYLQRLQTRAAAALGQPAAGPGDRRAIYLIVEKILGSDEPLLTDWPVHGSTGYEFAAAITGIFIEKRRERVIDDTYVRFVKRRGGRLSFDDLVYASKKQILHETMSGDINSLGHQLNRFSERNRHFRDFTLYSLISALKEVTACFPVYRTYIATDRPISNHDRRYVREALDAAKRRSPGTMSLVFDFIQRLLLGTGPALSDDDEAERQRFIGKLQQITGPVAAKGVEDTAFYIYNRLLSLNEVGGDPTRLGIQPAGLHQWLAERQRLWPNSLSTTGTHDTKRGEDVRARLNVLSELALEWRAAAARWRALNRRFKREIRGLLAPDANEEYFIYQTLAGAWPFARDEEPSFRERLRTYLTKALREARVNTSWLRPDDDYEAAVWRFVEGILDPSRPFLDTFRPFQARVAEHGIYNSLAQLLLKITAPGVPDFYQGTELWDLSLVDPDNRRPVAYQQRQALLAELPEPSPAAARALLDARRDGRIKLFTMTHGLRARRQRRDLFEHGEYVPLRTLGTHAERIFTFARRLGGAVSVTCVPRLTVGLTGDGAIPPIGETVWQDTAIELPGTMAGSALVDVFTGEAVDIRTSGATASIAVSEVCAHLPFAMLVTR